MKILNFYPKHYKQRGQLLPITLVFLIIISAVTLFMYNSGQMVQEKIRLTNTADIAAYGGATRMTRLLNLTGYSNRAMVANSISIGHAVGLASWLRNLQTAYLIGKKKKPSVSVEDWKKHTVSLGCK